MPPLHASLQLEPQDGWKALHIRLDLQTHATVDMQLVLLVCRLQLDHTMDNEQQWKLTARTTTSPGMMGTV